MTMHEPKLNEEQEPPKKSPLELIRDHWRRILVGTLLVVIVISLVHGAAESHLEHKDKMGDKSALIGDPSKKGLAGATWVVPVPVRLNKTFQWRVELRNTLEHSIRVSMGELLHPGMSPEEPSGNSAVLRSAKGTTDRVWTEWNRVLAPGEEATVWTQWRARKPRALGISAVLSWQSVEDPEVRGTVVASLRDIQVATPWRTFWAHAVKCFVALLGILTVPVILAAAGFWFQQYQKVVEQERQEKQERIDRERQIKQEEIDHKRQVWAKMLPTSHQLNMDYYLPLKGTVSSVERDLGSFREASRKDHKRLAEEALDRAFHYFLLTMRLYRLASDEAGGFYFKNRRGERLVADLLNLFIDHMLLRLRPYEDLSALLDVMKPDDTLSSLEEEIVRQELKSKHAKVKRQFKAWVTGEEKWAFTILLISKHLLDFEVNSIYEDWYEKVEPWPEEIDRLAQEWWKRDRSEPTAKLLSRLSSYGRDRLGRNNNPQENFMRWYTPL